MSAPTRYKRPELERSQPIRHWRGLFGSPEKEGATTGSGGNGTPPAWTDAVPKAVDLGYRVIEEYLREGQEVARSGRAPSGFPHANGVDARKMSERLYRQMADLAATWLDYVWTTMPGVPAANPRAPAKVDAGPFDIGSPTPRRSAAGGNPVSSKMPDACRITFDITSHRRVELTVDLTRVGSDTTMLAHELRAKDPSFPRIAGILVEQRAAEGDLVVRITVPDEIPPATYTGLIVSEDSNLPRGTLSLRVVS